MVFVLKRFEEAPIIQPRIQFGQVFRELKQLGRQQLIQERYLAALFLTETQHAQIKIIPYAVERQERISMTMLISTPCIP
ncbi:hypothetical protein Daud_0198 [Candidatus Desulforudis audaxviator MP104C]|uniref:Uncharacterized protein n=1 Tax=Desulforudis audaxviator (strain MP104C) TaxID=477974 RepID=B1I0R4_DESAP|nr:hypothetical protein Daud_0198 [Candidatus Desulforudis audaxviator MP104C]AZK58771.1 hypothetical protein Daudx_0213 [Candidatus Desulforudis audaxviator]